MSSNEGHFQQIENKAGLNLNFAPRPVQPSPSDERASPGSARASH